MKKFFVFMGVVIVLAVAGVYFLQGRGIWQIKKEISIPQETKETPAGGTNPQEPPLGITKDLSSIADHLSDLANDFDASTPFAIQGIWVQDGMFYVEYTNAKSALAQLFVVKEGEIFKGKGYFAPSESGWVLQAGEGDLPKPNAVLYLKDSNGSWKRKN